MTLPSPETFRFWTKKKIAAILLIAFAIVDVVGAFYTPILQHSIGPLTQFVNVGYWSTLQPPFSATISTTFTVTGLLSVDTSVHIHVDISSVNITDLNQHYRAMAFTNARDQNGGLIPLPIVPSQNNANEYTADATVVWIVAGPTWPYFLPVTPNTLVVRFADVEQGDPTINIASFSDVNIAITETKLTIFLLGFSVLMLQPIFEALLGLETPKQNLQAKPPLFHWPHRKPKKSQSQVPPTASV